MLSAWLYTYLPVCQAFVAYGPHSFDIILGIEKNTAILPYYNRGVTHNIPLLRDVLTEKVFNSGVFTTNYLPETYPDGFKGISLNNR